MVTQDIVPFMTSRLPGELRSRIDLIAMLGPSNHASFEFHLADIVADISREGDLPVLTEVEKLRGVPMLRVRGDGERRSLCPALASSPAQVETRRRAIAPANAAAATNGQMESSRMENWRETAVDAMAGR